MWVRQALLEISNDDLSVKALCIVDCSSHKFIEAKDKTQLFHSSQMFLIICYFFNFVFTIN